MILRQSFTLLSLILLFCSGCAPITTLTEVAKIYPGLDSYHFEITTKSPEAQRWFNQGFQLIYGFNHDEAGRSFQEAAQHDPKSAMAWWGTGIVLGMNINDRVVTEERWERGFQAAQKALSLLDEENEKEKALVQAMAKRFTWPAPKEQRPYDEAYAKAMKKVHQQFPDDPDIATLYAESLMNLQPWDYWTEQKEPKGNNKEFIAVIEKVLEGHPDHPGASHLYIHAMEAGPTPEKAVPFADRLRTRIPGSGHLVHMPSHIYVRVGRYADAADANIEAVKIDKAYLDQAPPAGIYLVYYAHNLHFLAYSSMMEGRYEPAIQAARQLEAEMPRGPLEAFAGLIEGIMPSTYHVMIRFGKWEEILKEEPPKEDFRLVSKAVHHYARGIAYSALGKTEEAKKEILLFDQASRVIPEEWFVFNNRISTVLPIARSMLEGELAYREGRLEDAWAALRKGIELEDQLIYDEPPGWMLPVRHAMGALLMASKKYAEAEKLYREDLERHPKNTWSLLGLRQSLDLQENRKESQLISRLLDIAWKRVKNRPTSSCYCEPGPTIK